MTVTLVLALLLVLLSWGLTAGVCRWALQRQLLDVPNARSSHRLPTPRGGGLAFVLPLVLCLPLLFLLALVEARLALALGPAGALVAVMGYVDDTGHVAARWRLLGHFVAAAWALLCLGELPPLVLFGFELGQSLIGWLLATLLLVWLLNLFNFMDGIDGIAGLEAVSVTLAMAVIYWTVGFAGNAVLLLLSAMAVLGFLFCNWPPARIFMGDVGSGFLGLWLAVLALHGGLLSVELFWAWLVMLGVFMVDASVTLLRRLMRGEKVYHAHRRHAYQFASRRWHSHARVTVAVGLLNVVWLFPWAWVAAAGHLPGLIVLLLAWLPLMGLALVLGAGRAEKLDAAQ
nr:glycosyltransferase family 4 protein [Halopseudomonas salegens]